MGPGNLDPRAQEFRPAGNFSHLARPPLMYYPTTSPYGYMPFCDTATVSYSNQPPQPLPISLPGPPPQQHQTYFRGGQLVTPHPPNLTTTAATRAVVLSSVPVDISETIVRRELEVFGEVRAVQMEKVLDGIVTVHFYDLRHAQMALREIREQHMQQQSRLREHYAQKNSVGGVFVPPPLPPPAARGLIAGRAVWAQFVIPSTNFGPDGNNQGTIVIFNLDSHVSSRDLRQIFEPFGAVRELRETPLKRHQRFIEYFDVRDAAKALAEMNGKEINGKSIIIEFSRPGGHNRRSSNNASNQATTGNHNQSPSPLLPQKLYAGRTASSSSSSNNVNMNFSRSYCSQFRHQSKKSIESSMSCLSVSATGVVGNGSENTSTSTSSKRNSKKGNYNSTSGKQGEKGRNRPWKSRHRSLDTHFLINEDGMAVESNCRDSRTTVMIKNIPNKYSQKLLLNMLDNHCIHCNEQIADGEDQPLSSYDFVYLPIDFNNKCNVGYGFVNMTSPEATLRLYKAFHLQHWEVFNSRKICEVTYARLQGLEALKEHFKNSKFPCEKEEYMPVVFSPPRDGRQLTDPLPIVGLSRSPNPSFCTASDDLDGPDSLDQCENASYHDIDDDDNEDEENPNDGGDDNEGDEDDNSNVSSSSNVALSN
ncbi:Mei2-like, C-terminal RNA recognition motif [Dillenia turbinata]|uniref:Mei2-like, C-terminal RNA recognition motif n=1 Tax=Dillenia turbinata TaxID=194707 RepID=A0AAN8VB51_9MAGN